MKFEVHEGHLDSAKENCEASTVEKEEVREMLLVHRGAGFEKETLVNLDRTSFARSKELHCFVG